jgi:hypothetical protein
MTRQTILTVFLWLGLLPCRAQVAHPDIAAKYPPGVVSEVYGIVLNTLIPHGTQLKLAGLARQRDMLVMEAAQRGQLQYIKNALDSFRVLMDAAIPVAYRAQYETYLHRGFVEGNAKATVAALQKRLPMDSATARQLYTMHRARQLASIKGYAALAAGGPLPDSVARTMALTDSLYQSNLIVAKGEGYFAAALQRLRSAGPLDTKTETCLRKQYVAHTLRHGDNYHQNFNMAMRHCVMDSAHFKAMYEDSLAAVIASRAQGELTAYRYRYNLPQWAVDSIAPLAYEKARRGLWLETRHPVGRTGDSLIAVAREISWQRIKNKLVRLGYYALATNRMGRALQWRHTLRITDSQQDSIHKYSLALDTVLQIASFRFGMEAKDRDDLSATFHLRHILTENQYDSLPFLESILPAQNTANWDWNEIKRYKLAEAADSAEIHGRLMHYYVTCLTLIKRQRIEPQKYERLAQVTIQNRPDILVRLHEAMKADGWTEHSIRLLRFPY